MEPEDFNRQAFVVPKEAPRRLLSLSRGMVVLLVLGTVGVGGYSFLSSNGLPGIEGQDEQFSEIVNKLREIEKRLDQLEKRRKVASPESSVQTEKPLLTDHDFGHTSDESRLRTPAALVLPLNPLLPQLPVGGARSPHSTGSQHELNQIPEDPTSARETWEATTARLGEAVGELGAQRAEIARTRDTLDELIRTFERTRYPFQLKRKSGRARVGPVWLQLRRTDRQKLRYTLAVFLDDNWIEVKDRALHEAVELYASGAVRPIELVVSEIGTDRVAGYLAVPKDELSRQAPGERK